MHVLPKVHEMKKILPENELSSAEFEEVIQLFFNALPDPIYVINQNGLFMKELGGNSDEITSFPRGMEGKQLSEILPPHIAESYLQAIDKAITNDCLTCIEYDSYQPTAKGDLETIQYFQARIFPLKQRKNDLRAVLWVAINKTEQKLLELRLKEQANIDGLTGAYNRRYFSETIKRSNAAFHRDNRPFCILMLDIDLFKSVNDNFGHDGGDKLLVELVNACSKSLRDIDLLARYGGEEFIILLPNTQEQDALSAAERIRTLVEQTSIIHKKQKINATISIGVSKVISDDSSHEEVIKRADIALYQAKNSGRNKVVIV